LLRLYTFIDYASGCFACFVRHIALAVHVFSAY